MQIVIDIPEGLKLDFENEQWTALSCMEMKDAIVNGIVLPKGHGDLIDKNELIKNGVATKDYLNTFIDTIIEADRSEEE